MHVPLHIEETNPHEYVHTLTSKASPAVRSSLVPYKLRHEDVTAGGPGVGRVDPFPWDEGVVRSATRARVPSSAYRMPR